MGWRDRETLGERLVAQVHDILHIDDRYIVPDPLGFTYWAGESATRVETDQGLFRQGSVTYRVTARTEVIRTRGHLRDVAIALEHEMDECTFSAPDYDRAQDVISLGCGVYLGDENAEWLERLFTAAVALQVTEAFELANTLTFKTSVSKAISAHPQTGPRQQFDENLLHSRSMFLPVGDQPSAWRGVEEWKRTKWVLEREAFDWETDEQTFFNACFRWACGDEPMRLVMTTEEPHPKLGQGLHATLTVPMPLGVEAIAHLLLDLNHIERIEYKRCHSLGSWCEHDGRLAFRLFIPNALYDPRILEELCVTMSTRAIWVDEWFQAMKEAAQTQS
ncbi:MAG: hypothetical protein KF812_07240 [Fimbriimonadaceae bacterium]|nr:hypothetical protein [Fimbriimonadaceae bacterium]